MADLTIERPGSPTTLWSLARISWSGVFAGAISMLAIIITLNMLGIWADAGGPVGLGAAVWFVVSSLIAYFVGGAIAARLAGIPNKGIGRLHGIVAWGLSTLSLFVVALYLSSYFVGVGAQTMANVTPAVRVEAVGPVAAFVFFQCILGALCALLGASVGTPDSLLAISAPISEVPAREQPRRVA